MRIITWNVHRARKDSPLWDFLLHLQPDLVLLQEVGCIPSHVTNEFDHLTRPAIAEDGSPQNFHTGVLAKGKIIAEVSLSSDREWVNRELEFFGGNLVGCRVQLSHGSELHVVSVHSPFWPVDKAKLAGIDVSQVRTTNPHLFATDLLWYALKNMVTTGTWIVGGDFNSSETFDPDWRRRNRKNWTRIPGSAQTLRRMRALGFTECLRKSEQDPIIPTFRHSRGRIDHQIDHLFVSNNLMPTLEECKVGAQSIIFGKSLSDHLPVIADFGECRTTSQVEPTNEISMAGVMWTSASSYPDAPHEYVLRERYPDTYAFYQEGIAQKGLEEPFTLRGRTATYRYYYAGDGYKYWTIGNVLNRALAGRSTHSRFSHEWD